MDSVLLRLFYPAKCVLCKKVLEKHETDLCRACREQAPEFPGSKIKHSFLAQWTGVWYYKDNVRSSLLRYKFRGRRSYARCYSRILAMKLQSSGWTDWDLLSYIPISRQRKWVRGYDQTELIARATAQELGVPLVPTLRKIRNTKPQSQMGGPAHRRANILGAYVMTDPELVRDQRILLLDDIVTTGTTASEAARMLLTAGAKEVKLATIAVASYDKSR